MKKSAFRFRLYPNRKQEQRMLTMVDAGRRLWNDALAHRKRRWEEKRLSTSYSQQCWILTAERRANPSFRELYSQAGQGIRGVFRAPGDIPEIQEVLTGRVVHLPASLQRVGEV